MEGETIFQVFIAEKIYQKEFLQRKSDSSNLLLSSMKKFEDVKTLRYIFSKTYITKE